MRRWSAPLIGLSFTLLLVAVSCTLKIPGTPVWTIQVTVPFSKRVYRLAELVTDSARLAERGWGIIKGRDDSTLIFEYHDEIDYQQIGDRIKIEATETRHYNNEIGALNIEEPRPDTIAVLLAESMSSAEGGQRGAFISFTFNSAQDTIEFDVFHWARARRGWVVLEVINRYPVNIEDLTISLSNLADNTSIGTVTFPGSIPPDGAALDSIDLATRLVYNELLMITEGRLGGSGRTAGTDDDEALFVVVGITRMEADSAESEFSRHDFSSRDSLETESDNQVAEAVIKEGWAYVEVTNTLPAKVIDTTYFENIRDPDGNRSFYTDSLMPEGILSDSVNLAGYTITMELDDQRVHVQNRAVMDEVTTYQIISRCQGVEVDYYTGDLIFSRFNGILDSVQVGIPTLEVETDFPRGLDSIDFVSDTLLLTIYNETSLPMRLDMKIEGFNFQRHIDTSLTVQTDLLSGTNRIVVPDADRLTRIVPDLFRVTGNAGIGARFFPEYANRVVRVDDAQGFSGSINLNSELKFTMGACRITTDPVRLGDTLDFAVESVDLSVHLVNSIPLGGTVRLLMGNDISAMDTIIEAVIPRLDIVDHRVEAAVDSSYFSLTSSQLDIIRGAPVYTRQVIEFESIAGDTVWLYGGDTLSVQASAVVRYTVDFNSGENE